MISQIGGQGGGGDGDSVGGDWFLRGRDEPQAPYIQPGFASWPGKQFNCGYK